MASVSQGLEHSAPGTACYCGVCGGYYGLNVNCLSTVANVKAFSP